MEQMLIRVLNMSLTAGVVILAVIPARLMLRRTPMFCGWQCFSGCYVRFPFPWIFRCWGC